MKIEIKKIDHNELESQNVKNWPIWEKEESEFGWYYDSTEQCYLLEGKVIVTTEDGKDFEFGKGDFVTFPKGLACNWKILKAVKKHYNFLDNDF